MSKILQSYLRHFRTASTIFKRFSSTETDLKAVLASKIPEQQERIKAFRKSHGKAKVGEVTVDMVYGGMRGIKSLICETSHLDPQEGIRFRGYTIEECQEKLPKAEGGHQPLPEGLFWLLVTGDIPTQDQVLCLSEDWARRGQVPSHVCRFLKQCPKHVHPMSQFAAACTILNTESQFVEAYHKGVKKNKYWEYVYEDAINLIGKVVGIAAIIYHNTFKESRNIPPIDTSKDWSMNFANMLCYDEPDFVELMRMYFTIHSDHEGGNVSAHTTHLVGSALSDPFISFAAGMNGLAGPLHGLANQEVLIWLLKLQKELGDDPSEEQVKTFAENTLKCGQVIPGYGHAVLRITDPRYCCQSDFASKHLPDDPLVKIVAKVFNVVPPILQSLGKVQNPWPNVDAHSGVLLRHYGLTEMSYYTVLFGISRCLGVMASLIWSRALGLPIERPKSLTTELLMNEVGADGKSSKDDSECEDKSKSKKEDKNKDVAERIC